jgi:peroxin-6
VLYYAKSWLTLNQTDDLAIPPDWCTVYRAMFPQAHLNQSHSAWSSVVSVTVTQPLLLTEVIVTALSAEAYRLANGGESPLETWFSKERPIIRHGSIYLFSSDHLKYNGHHTSDPPKTFAYRFDMVEPVLQGFAQRGTTRFIVIFNDRPRENSMITDTIIQDDAESNDEGIEIDEGFLANSAFSSPIFHPIGNQQQPTNTHNANDAVNASGSEIAFRIKPLSDAVDTVEDHSTIYLRTADLGRTGFLNGDWVSSLQSAVVANAIYQLPRQWPLHATS